MIKFIRNLFVNRKQRININGDELVSRRFMDIGNHPFKIYEPNLDSIWNWALKKEGAVIDVGANCGQTLGTVIRHDKAREYHGFEIQTFAAGKIEAIILENRLENKFIYPIGFSNKTSVLRFQSFEGFHSHLFNTGASFENALKAKQNVEGIDRSAVTMVGDDFLDELDLQNISTIKIDVEGHEYYVLEGLQKTIAEHQPNIIFECLPFAQVSTDDKSVWRKNAERIQEIMERHDYLVFSVSQTGEIQEMKLGSNEHDHLGSRDFFAGCKSRMESFKEQNSFLK